MKALITQREQVDSYGGAIDVLESTYVTYFEQLGMELFQLSNFTTNLDKILSDIKFDIIILTGGGSVSNNFYIDTHNDICQENRDALEWRIMEHSIERGIPILGICRGMQHMNAFLGGRLRRLEELKEERPIGRDHMVALGDRTEIHVNNYHNDGIYSKDLAKKFEIVALDVKNDIVEACCAKDLKWLGIQWHPERIMMDNYSKLKSRNLIDEFSRGGGIINESYYFSSRTRD